MHGIYHLKGTVKHYDWGGNSFIPSLLNETSKAGLPYAEYWLGIHPQAGCVVNLHGGGQQSLEDFLQERSLQLPFLLKVLDVKDMLSIQVHPSKAAAEKEFARENAAGIPIDSPQRNYRDNNHKPELAVA